MKIDDKRINRWLTGLGGLGKGKKRPCEPSPLSEQPGGQDGLAPQAPKAPEGPAESIVPDRKD
ncbi:MAG: hypothetical protein H0S85_14000 [Desulfovibrionaceae bacterium]|jgi:hypothetical protein|nr:hypothetical protein [Desulfovibrionaceae bacterium]